MKCILVHLYLTSLQILAAGLFKHEYHQKIKRIRYFCYSKNTNKVNVHKCKNQNTPGGYLPVHSQQ